MTKHKKSQAIKGQKTKKKPLNPALKLTWTHHHLHLHHQSMSRRENNSGRTTAGVLHETPSLLQEQKRETRPRVAGAPTQKKKDTLRLTRAQSLTNPR